MSDISRAPWNPPIAIGDKLLGRSSNGGWIYYEVDGFFSDGTPSIHRPDMGCSFIWPDYATSTDMERTAVATAQPQSFEAAGRNIAYALGLAAAFELGSDTGFPDSDFEVMDQARAAGVWNDCPTPPTKED